MACGQKKQNNQGGVHLTERTCSPYNPIIKQIVDDCLGLPIYPVTSIDAVIDEDGNTLRRLFDKLLEDLKTESGHAEEILNDIENAILDLDDVYTKKEDFATLKALVWAISSMATEPYEQNLYSNGIPTIVAKIKELETLIEHIEIPEDLQQSVNTLSEILFGIANYNTNYPADKDNKLILQEGKIAIIKEIIDIKARLDRLENSDINWDEVLPNASGNIVEKIKYLLTKIRELESAFDSLVNSVSEIIQATKSYAHLDEVLLEQVPTLLGGSLSGDIVPGLPDGKTPSDLDPTSGTGGSSTVVPGGTTVNPEDVPQVNPGTSTDDPTEEPTDDLSNNDIPSIHNLPAIPEEYAKLKASEYPLTSISILTAENIVDFGTKRTQFVYYGNLYINLNTSSGDPYDIYPIGHTTLDVGNPLFVKRGSSDDPLYIPIVDADNQKLRCGNNIVNNKDIDTIINVIFNQLSIDTALYELDKTTEALNLENETIYIKINDNEHRKLGDINNDGEVNVRDILSLIERILHSETSTDSQESSDNYFNSKYDLRDYIVYYDENDNPKVYYPCIDGKVYVDVIKEEAYRYSAAEHKMIKLKSVESEDETDSTQVKSNITLRTLYCTYPYLFGPYDEPNETPGFWKENEDIICSNSVFVYNPKNLTLETVENEYTLDDLSDYNFSSKIFGQIDKLALNNNESAKTALNQFLAAYDSENPSTFSYSVSEDFNALDYRYVKDGTLLSPDPMLYDLTAKVIYVFNQEGYNAAIVEANGEEVDASEYLSYYGKLTFVNSAPVLENIIYYFKDFGIQLRFEIDSEGKYVPIVVNQEMKAVYNTSDVVQCNTCMNLEAVAPITLDLEEFLQIPGNSALEARGLVTTSDTTPAAITLNHNYTYQYEDNSETVNVGSIMPSGRQPTISANRMYKFTILDNRFSCEDITASR